MESPNSVTPCQVASTSHETPRSPPKHTRAQPQDAAKLPTLVYSNSSLIKDSSPKVIVTGFPPWIQLKDLSLAFSEFGKVRVDVIQPKVALLSFSSESEAAKAVKASTKLVLNGNVLTVKMYMGGDIIEKKKERKPTSPKRKFPKSKQKDSNLLTQNTTTFEMAAVVRKSQREYLGMIEYRSQDEPLIMQKLIIDLKPRVAQTLLPGLPAYIVFMMIRHMDHVDDEPKMHQLIKSFRISVKKILKKRADIVEYNVLWLANMLRLLNNLRQYSGDEIYQVSNTARQNSQCLRIFDLSEYRQLLSDNAIGIYQGLITLLERQLERLIVPAILEHEEISGLGGRATPPSPPSAGSAKLKQELLEIHRHLVAFAVDQPLRAMIFKQLFYFICAFSLNQLLLRKDLCCWNKGLQIRYNISHMETWIKENLAEYGQKTVEDILDVLKPITEAVQLLQARKSMADIQSTVDMCSHLNAQQVCKILNMWRVPVEDYELRVTKEFIQETRKKMLQRPGEDQNQHLLLDTKMIYSVRFEYNPSPIRLEDVEVPEVLGLEGLLIKT